LIAAAIVLLFLGVARSPPTFALLVLLYYFFYGANGLLCMALAEVIYPERTGSSIGGMQAVFNGVYALAIASMPQDAGLPYNH